ncbi:hypothetical protein [Ancylobacter pratisalsi]|nr:hypothetical protein [Ancylobacter pratisalsi]
MNRRSLLLGAGPVLLATPAATLPVAPARATPQERIAAAMDEIRSALWELHPDWHISGDASFHSYSVGGALGAHPHGYSARHFFDDAVGKGDFLVSN